ncbi:MAG: nucleoside deaminase [Ferruginibacter sp.]|nr:nucleoside deaminase [Cytophagales bacterium]
MDHRKFMERCFQLAETARQRGDSPVGSLLVRRGQVIGEGIEGGKTHRDITFHAEIEAVRSAVAALGSYDLTGCTLYTSHEPCLMCAYVIRHARISTVVMNQRSGEIGGVSSAYPLLTANDISVWGKPPDIVHYGG